MAVRGLWEAMQVEINREIHHYRLKSELIEELRKNDKNVKIINAVEEETNIWGHNTVFVEFDHMSMGDMAKSLIKESTDHKASIIAIYSVEELEKFHNVDVPEIMRPKFKIPSFEVGASMVFGTLRVSYGMWRRDVIFGDYRVV